MRIYLIGMPGSGKSTVSRDLAPQLNLKRIDMDEEIVKKEGATIEEIFSKKGEVYFRDLESSVLKEISVADNILVSTGGGSPCFFDNMKFMNDNGVTVFLDVPEKELLNRITTGKDQSRPMVKNKTREEILQFLIQKSAERKPFYEQAKLIFRGSSISTAEIIKAIETI